MLEAKPPGREGLEPSSGKLLGVVGLMLSVIVVSQAGRAQTAAAPQATAPPVIIDVRSKSRLCTVLERSIGPSIAGLMQNDYTIMHGLSVLHLASSGDKTLHAGMDMDDVKLEGDVSSIVRNLAKIDHLLQPAPADADPANAEKIETMKKSLRDVAYAQLMTLNLLDGALDTRQLLGMMDLSDIPNFSLPDGDVGSASPGQAFANPGTATPNPRFPRSLKPGDFFPKLRESEARANQIIVADAASCMPVNHALSVDNP